MNEWKSKIIACEKWEIYRNGESKNDYAKKCMPSFQPHS